MVERYDVGIVGGSIGGCGTAIGLSRLGHRVVVFERSSGGLPSRGAGIATPSSVIDSMMSPRR
jgi:2-polyprenyl-6-methoxyphenol hydroxylase-like FAD-dependent oxidoreductase